MKKYAKLLPLILIMFPLVVLAIGGTKRVIDLPGFTTDRLLFVDANNELQDTGITVGGSDDTLSGIASLNGITSTTLGYVDFTSSGQTQLDAKLDDFTGVADNALVRTNGTGGDAVQETGLIVDDSDNISGLQAITAEAQTATVSTPSAGSLSMYFKSDGNLYKKDENGIEQQIGSASSGINYFSDFQADIIGNVAEFDDTSAIVDGTGGSPANLATSLETTNPLSGQASYKLQKDVGANAQYEGFSIDTDTPDRTSTVGGETVYVTFNYETSANYDNDASGEQVSIYVYRVGSNTLESCNTRDVLSGSFTNALPVAPDGGQYQCVTTLESTDTAVRVIFGVTGTGTSTWDLVVDKIKVGPDAVVTAPIVTEWQEYDLTIGGSTSAPTIATTVTTNVAYWRRVGDSAQIIFNYQHTDNTGTAAGTGSYLFPAPSECTVDSTKLSNNSGVPTVGSAQVFSGSTAAVGVVGRSGNNLLIYVGNDATAPTTVGSTFLPITGSTVQYNFHAQVPCEEFSGNPILSTTQADHQTVKAKYVITSATANSSVAHNSSETLDYNNKIYDSHNTVTTGASWLFTAPRDGKYRFTATVDWANTTNMTRNTLTIVTSGRDEALYDIDVGQIMGGSVVIDMNAGDTAYPSIFTTDLTTAARSIDTGSELSYITIESLPDFSTFSVFGVDQPLSAVSSTKTVGTTGDYLQMTGNSLTLDPGDWLVIPSINANNNGSGPNYEYIALDIYGANGADTSSQPAGVDTLAGASFIYTKMITPAFVYDPESASSISNFRGSGVPQRIRLTQSQTIYAVPQIFAGTIANTRVEVKITAERIK